MSGVTDAIRVYVVDDHPVVRQGLHAVLSAEHDIVVVGHAGSGDIAMCELVRSPADVVVVDHQLASGISGTRLLRLLCAPPFSLRCLVLTAAVVPPVVHELIGTGVTGVMSKSSDIHHIVAAVRSVAAGQSYFDHHVLHALVQRQHDPHLRQSFDARDRLILGYLASGMSNPQIAGVMRVSPSSVKKYVSVVLRKLGVAHRASAVAAAAARGLLDDDTQAHPSTPRSGHLATPFVASRPYAPLATSR
jgi:two-component system, NarL family, response regulator DevR